MSFPTKLDPLGERIWKPEDQLEVLQEVEKGAKIVEVCRKYQINPGVYYPPEADSPLVDNWEERY